jgi:tetratricopeptide (TPR) repeat protein
MKKMLFSVMISLLAPLAFAQQDTSGKMVITDKADAVEIRFGDSTITISHDAMYFENLSKGVEQANAGNYETALSYFNTALLFKSDEAQVYYNRGLVYHLQKRYQDALAELNIAIELDSLYSEAYNQRGIDKCLLERTEDALKDFHRAVDLDPKGLNYYNMAVAYLQSGDFETACTHLKKALELGYSQSAALQEKYCQ